MILLENSHFYLFLASFATLNRHLQEKNLFFIHHAHNKAS